MEVREGLSNPKNQITMFLPPTISRKRMHHVLKRIEKHLEENRRNLRKGPKLSPEQNKNK